MSVKIIQRQPLYMDEQILADFLHHRLGGFDHQLAVGQRGQGPAQIHDSHAGHRSQQTF